MTAGAHVTFSSAPALTESQLAAWRAFAATVPWAHYRQDPAWVEAERREGGLSVREPWFCWGEKDGCLCLTALGTRRRLPVPGYVFWEFNLGPTVADPEVLDAWLGWLPARLGRSAARVRVQPPAPLAAGGDHLETLLERHGYARRRLYGGWTTLLLDLDGDEDQILAGFRNATQRAIKKSRNLGVTVTEEDGPEGWRTLAGLQSELGRRAAVPPLDAGLAERISRHWLRGGEGGTVLVARHDGQVLAAALVVTHQRTAYLPIIPSRRAVDVPASHLLVWETVRWAKEHGCTALDFVGYDMTAQAGDALAGINQFKRGFAPLDHLVRTVAMHELVRAPRIVALSAAARKAQTLVARRG